MLSSSTPRASVSSAAFPSPSSVSVSRFTAGDYVDAYAVQDDEWYLCRVVSTSATDVLLHFVGWAPGSDEKYTYAQCRDWVRPPFTHTKRPKEGEIMHEYCCALCEEGGEVMECDTCEHVWHWTCLGMQEPVPDALEWRCAYCQIKKRVGWKETKKTGMAAAVAAAVAQVEAAASGSVTAAESASAMAAPAASGPLASTMDDVAALAQPNADHAAAGTTTDTLFTHDSLGYVEDRLCHECTSWGDIRLSKCGHFVHDECTGSDRDFPVCKTCLKVHHMAYDGGKESHAHSGAAAASAVAAAAGGAASSPNTSVAPPIAPSQQKRAVSGDKEKAAAAEALKRSPRRKRQREEPAPIAAAAAPVIFGKRFGSASGSSAAAPGASPSSPILIDSGATTRKPVSLRAANMRSLEVVLRTIHYHYVHRKEEKEGRESRGLLDDRHMRDADEEEQVEEEEEKKGNAVAASSSAAASGAALIAAASSAAAAKALAASSAPSPTLRASLIRHSCNCTALFYAPGSPRPLLSAEQARLCRERLDAATQQHRHIVDLLEQHVQDLDAAWQRLVKRHIQEHNQRQADVIRAQSDASLSHVARAQLESELHPLGATPSHDTLRSALHSLRTLQSSFDATQRAFRRAFEDPFRQFEEHDRFYQVLVDAGNFMAPAPGASVRSSTEWQMQLETWWGQTRDLAKDQTHSGDAELALIVSPLTAFPHANHPFDSSVFCFRCGSQCESAMALQQHISEKHLAALSEPSSVGFSQMVQEEEAKAAAEAKAVAEAAAATATAAEASAQAAEAAEEAAAEATAAAAVKQAEDAAAAEAARAAQAAQAAQAASDPILVDDSALEESKEGPAAVAAPSVASAPLSKRQRREAARAAAAIALLDSCKSSLPAPSSSSSSSGGASLYSTLTGLLRDPGTLDGFLRVCCSLAETEQVRLARQEQRERKRERKRRRFSEHVEQEEQEEQDAQEHASHETSTAPSHTADGATHAALLQAYAAATAKAAAASGAIPAAASSLLAPSSASGAASASASASSAAPVRASPMPVLVDAPLDSPPTPPSVRTFERMVALLRDPEYVPGSAEELGRHVQAAREPFLKNNYWDVAQ